MVKFNAGRNVRDFKTDSVPTPSSTMDLYLAFRRSIAFLFKSSSPLKEKKKDMGAFLDLLRFSSPSHPSKAEATATGASEMCEACLCKFMEINVGFVHISTGK